VSESERVLRLPASVPSSGHYVLHYNPERATFTGGIAASAQKHFLGFASTVIASLAVLLFGFCAGLGKFGKHRDRLSLLFAAGRSSHD
jgi:hypothetical protein